MPSFVVRIVFDDVNVGHTQIKNALVKDGFSTMINHQTGRRFLLPDGEYIVSSQDYGDTKKRVESIMRAHNTRYSMFIWTIEQALWNFDTLQEAPLRS